MAYRNLATSFLAPWAAVIIAGFVVYRYSSKTCRRKLPPGPKPLPLIGNVRDFPPTGMPEFEHWIKHKDLYGPISSVSVLGTTLVLIHDENIAQDLLDKTASVTSGRPSPVFGIELCGYGRFLSTRTYDSTFRQHRKIIHQAIGTKRAAEKFEGGQEVEVGRTLVRALDDPGQWRAHLKT